MAETARALKSMRRSLTPRTAMRIEYSPTDAHTILPSALIFAPNGGHSALTRRTVKRIAISQSNYIPWKGYFDLISTVDEFVLYDDAQFTRRDWRNRNQIKTPTGLKWLTIPVSIKGRFLQKISETRISDPAWAKRHWRSIALNYARAAHFADYREQFEQLYCDDGATLLSAVNYRFLSAISSILGIRTPLSLSSEFELAGDRSQRLVNICKQARADVYVSGPAAKEYLDVAIFENAGIGVEWMDYAGYPEYRQLHGEFVHSVSVIDLLFNEGPNAHRFLKRNRGNALPG